MRVVSIGDLVTDFYYKDNKILGANGGMTSHNIIANLAKMGIDTSVFGAVGNDIAGIIAIKSLKDIGVDTNNIKIIDNVNTRCFHVSYFNNDNILTFTSKKRCPFCNNKNWYDESLIDVENIESKLEPDDILVFDNLNGKNQKLIDNVNNKKVIDLGQYYEFESLTNDEILKKIESKFELINLNERVSKYLLNRFNLKNDNDIYKLTKAKLITITKGKKGARFILEGQIYDFKLEKIEKEVDPTGAGDAFFASIIKDWLSEDFQINESVLNEWYNNSTKLTSKVVKKMGARGHINFLYKIRKSSENCTCIDFEIAPRKQIKRCNININNLKTRLINAVNSNAVKSLKNINFSEKENYIFVGTGGSFVAAKFASIIVNQTLGCNTYAVIPRDILYRNNKSINKVILFSYSGTTNDLLQSTKDFSNNNKYIITKGDVQKIVLKTNISKQNIVSYRTNNNKSSERGFLSFEGAVAPSAIFLKYFYPDIDINNFIVLSIEYWNSYFEEVFKNKNMKEMFNIGKIINIFTGDNTSCASIDLESKIIESGILNCIVHEKKNFSHGRFINYENLNNKNSVYFKQKNTNNYEKNLLNYLKNDNNLIIESKYNDILAEFDLLIASQYLIYHIGKILNIDVSKPKYSEDAMKIYFYKGEIN